MSTIMGTLDDDRLYDKYGLQTDRIFGLAGDDTVYMADDKGYDLVDGGDGRDLVSYELFQFGEVGVTIDLALGLAKDGYGYVDQLVSIEDARGSNYEDEISGDSGANALEGLNGDDSIYGLGGDDRLDGGVGEDFLEGGAGADKIDGGSGIDMASYANSASGVVVSLATGTGTGGEAQGDRLCGIEDLRGSEFADRLTGNSGRNWLIGEGGNDVLDGGAGPDRLLGLTGNDTYVLADGNDVVVDTGGTADLVTTTISRSLMAAGLTVIENLTLVSGNINGTGNNLNNLITGSSGDNVLTGGNGADTLRGLDGKDTLVGGVGIDVLTGGAGNDIFVFNAPLSPDNRDVVTDFFTPGDTFHLENAVMTGLGAAGALNANLFYAGAAAHDANDRIVYNQASGALSYDANGNAAGGVTQLATLQTKPALSVADFVVI